MPMNCFSEGISVSSRNIVLFKQPNIACNNQVEGPVCLNPAQKIANRPAHPFFAACEGAAYTYPTDNDALISNLESTLVPSYIGTSCNAPSRQPKQTSTPNDERTRFRDTLRRRRGRSASSSFRHRQQLLGSRSQDGSRALRYQLLGQKVADLEILPPVQILLIQLADPAETN